MIALTKTTPFLSLLVFSALAFAQYSPPPTPLSTFANITGGAPPGSIPRVSATGGLQNTTILLGGDSSVVAANLWIGNGHNNGSTITSGSNSLSIGYLSGDSLTSGSYNVFLGLSAGQACTSCSNQIFIGPAAGQRMTVPTLGTVAIGSGTLSNAVNTISGVFIGLNNAVYGTSLNYSNAIGAEAAEYAGQYAGATFDALGESAFKQAHRVQHSVAVGQAAGYSATTTTGSSFLSPFTNFLVPPDGATFATQAGAGLGIGFYCYKQAWEFDGVESGLNENNGGDCPQTTSGNQQVVISNIPTFTPGLNCTHSNWYRTSVQTSVDFALSQPYKLLVQQACNATSYTDSTPDGSLGAEHVDPDHVLAIGAGTTLQALGGFPAAPWKSKQAVLGSPDSPTTELLLGCGISPSPSSCQPHIRATYAKGTNLAGAALYLDGGASSGNGAPGPVVIETGSAGSSGTALNYSYSAAGTFNQYGLGLLSSVATSSYTLLSTGGVASFAGYDCQASFNCFNVDSSVALGWTQLNGAIKTLTVGSGFVNTILGLNQTNAFIAIGGPANSTSPAIKRVGTALNFRLADDSADAPIGVGVVTMSAPPRFNGSQSTAAVAGVIGTTCPAVTCTAAYTWIQATSSDGSTVYFPVWK